MQVTVGEGSNPFQITCKHPPNPSKNLLRSTICAAPLQPIAFRDPLQIPAMCVLVDLDPCSLVGGQIALPPFSPFQYKEKLWRFKKKQTSKTFFCKVNILIIMKMNNNKAVNTTSFLICITLSVLYLGN